MQRSSQPRAKRNQRGIAMIFCLFALILLSSIALGLIYMSDTETAINRNFRTSQQAYFAANAGLEEARSRLTPGLASPPGITLTLFPGTGPRSVVYIRNPKVVNGLLESVDPLDPANPYYDTELCHENHPGVGFTNAGFNIPCAAAMPTGFGWWTYVDSITLGTKTTSALNFKWARINLKTNATGAHGGTALGAAGGYYVDGGANSATYNTQVCWDGNQEILLPAGYGVPGQQSCDKPPTSAGVIYEPVVVITAFGQGSRRITQMEAAQNPPIITNAAVDSKNHVSLGGNLGVSGYDYCSCEKKYDAGGNFTGYGDRPGTGKTCDATKWAIYSAGNITQSGAGAQHIEAGPNPPMLANQDESWPYDIPKLVQSYTASPGTVDVTKSPAYGWSCTPATTPNTPANCGTQSGAVFGVPPNFPPSPVDNPIGPSNMAQQISYVPGSVSLHGNAVGNGVLVIDGDLEIDGGLQFYGLILVKGILKFKGGGSEGMNIYGAVIAGERSIDDTTATAVGGSFNIQYDYCALKDGRAPQPPTVLSFRELSY